MEWYGDYSTTVTRDGITVEKGIDLEHLPVPAVAYRITSTRDDPVGVKFVDGLPVSITPEHVGFSPEYGSKYWRVYDDNRLVWSRSLAPHASGVTLYGVWISDPTTVYDLLEPPRIEAVQPLNERDARAGQPRESDMAEDERPDWWWSDEETAPKHIVDRAFSNADSDHLRRMIDDVKGVLTGEPDPPEQTAETDADPEEDVSIEFPEDYEEERRKVMGGGAGVSLSEPDDGEIERLFDTGEPVPSGNRYHLRIATEGTRHGSGGSETVLQELMNALSVLDSSLTPGNEDSYDVLDVAIVTDHSRENIEAALDSIDRIEETVLTPVDTLESDFEWVDDLAEPPGASSMDEFQALKNEIDQVPIEELQTELDDIDLPGVNPDEEVTIDELIGEDDPTTEPASTSGEVTDAAKLASVQHKVQQVTDELDDVSERVAQVESRVLALETVVANEHQDVVRRADGVVKE